MFCSCAARQRCDHLMTYSLFLRAFLLFVRRTCCWSLGLPSPFITVQCTDFHCHQPRRRRHLNSRNTDEFRLVPSPPPAPCPPFLSPSACHTVGKIPVKYLTFFGAGLGVRQMSDMACQGQADLEGFAADLVGILSDAN